MKLIKCYCFKLVILTIILLSGCQTTKDNNKQNNANWLEEEFSVLKSEEDKEAYLIEMFERDQKLRTSNISSDILIKNDFDKNSEEYRDYLQKVMAVDSLNYERIKKYLLVFGYPKIEYQDYRANYSINAVSLHQSFQNQKEIFPFLYQAYKKESLSAKDFWFFLNKMHIIKYQNSFQSKIDSTSEDDKIMELINELGIQVLIDH